MSTRWFLRAPLVVATLLASAGCTSILGDFNSGSGDASTGPAHDSSTSDALASGDGSGGLPLGTACTATTVCGGGHSCVDGVCCESACDGVCEACNVAGMVGQCAPIPMNTDPDMECVAVSLPEAGPPEAGEEEASTPSADAGDATVAGDAAVDATLGGGSSGADSSVAASDASSDGAADGASTNGVAYPDGGVTITQTVCAGTCNGQRACAYPDTTTSCGTQFCEDPTTLERFACNSMGGCNLYASSCGVYACESTVDAGAPNVEGACVTSCSQMTDCSTTGYCNGQSCLPKLGDAIQCTIGSECLSGFCPVNTSLGQTTGVCCATACDPNGPIPGATCQKAGSEGTCQCNLDCGDGGTCQLFYQDADGDGFGNEFGSVSASPLTAQVACSNSPPNNGVGWVLNNTDCNDMDANVFPGQTAWFTVAIPTGPNAGTFNYSCAPPNTAAAKEYPEYPGASCLYCNGTAPSCSAGGECGASGDQAYLSCQSETECFYELSTRVQTQSVSAVIINPINPIRDCFNYCGGATTGFAQVTTCGKAYPYYTCGTCSTADTTTVTGTTSTSTVQACH
jgi:hypothetical protein